MARRFGKPSGKIMALKLPKNTLVLGGQRSGKSYYAEQMIETAGGGHYLATAQAFDEEMTARIETHQGRRGSLWTTHEEPLEIARLIIEKTRNEKPVLVDCLTLWLSNMMLAERDIESALEGLVDALANSNGPVVLVSNEVGQGVIPDNALARQFVDCAGRMNRLVAEASERVVFLTAGIPQILKDI